MPRLGGPADPAADGLDRHAELPGGGLLGEALPAQRVDIQSANVAGPLAAGLRLALAGSAGCTAAALRGRGARPLGCAPAACEPGTGPRCGDAGGAAEMPRYLA